MEAIKVDCFCYQVPIRLSANLVNLQESPSAFWG